MKKCKEKMLSFIKQHKKPIVIAGTAVAGVLGGLVGWKLCSEVKLGSSSVIAENEHIVGVIVDAIKTHGPNTAVFTGDDTGPIKVSDLGKLGEAIVSCGGVDDDTFTHFIAIGKPIERLMD